MSKSADMLQLRRTDTERSAPKVMSLTWSSDGTGGGAGSGRGRNKGIKLTVQKQYSTDISYYYYSPKMEPNRIGDSHRSHSFLISPLEDLKCLLGVVYPLVPWTLTAATLNWYQRPGRMSVNHTRSSDVYSTEPQMNECRSEHMNHWTESIKNEWLNI